MILDSIPSSCKFLKWCLVLQEGWPVVFLLRPLIHLLDNYSTMHIKADRKGSNKLREKSRANWLARGTAHCLRKWQVHGPELEKKRVLEGNGQRDGQSPQPRAGAPAQLSSGLLRAYMYIPRRLCHVFRVCDSHGQVRSQRDTWSHS